MPTRKRELIDTGTDKRYVRRRTELATLLIEGHGPSAIAKALGISRMSVHRALAA
jgi:DNA invertase Pin-like site-specific DNA recombinase